MNIEDLTYGQIKEIGNLFFSATPEHRPATAHPFIGKFVLCRCYAAGVHVGILESADGENVILKDSRRLWSWKAVDGVALSGVAQNGFASGKIDTQNPLIALTGVCEIIPMSDKAAKSTYEK